MQMEGKVRELRGKIIQRKKYNLIKCLRYTDINFVCWSFLNNAQGFLWFFQFPSSVASVQEVQVEKDSNKFLNIISNRAKIDYFYSGAQIPATPNITFLLFIWKIPHLIKITEGVCGPGKQLLKRPSCIRSSPNDPAIVHRTSISCTSFNFSSYGQNKKWLTSFHPMLEMQCALHKHLWKEGINQMVSHWE